MVKPWWVRPAGEDELVIHGEEGEGKVLVTIRRDRFNDPVEQVWCEPKAVEDWDESWWKSRR